MRGFEHDLQQQTRHAFHVELLEEHEEKDNKDATFDGVHTEADLGAYIPGRDEVEKMVNHEEDMELVDQEAEPMAEQFRKKEWRQLSQAERVGIRQRGRKWLGMPPLNTDLRGEYPTSGALRATGSNVRNCVRW